MQQRIQSEQSLTEQAQQQIKRLNEELTPLQLRFESQQQNLSDLRSQHKQFNEQQHTDSRIKVQMEAQIGQLQAELKQMEQAHLKAKTQWQSSQAQLQELQLAKTAVQGKLEDLQHRQQELQQALSTREEALRQQQEQGQTLRQQLGLQETRCREAEAQRAESKEKLALYQQEQEQQRLQHEQRIAQANQLFAQLEKQREALEAAEAQRQFEAHEAEKSTWRRHENQVQTVIHAIAQRQGIEYLTGDQVPFKGKPDNTLRIADEYVIFDAKSPQGEDLSNFPKYIKTQTEQIKKYCLEGVCKDLYLVVPGNTLHIIEQRHFAFPDYHVYIIGPDALESVIAHLRKIESYTFIEQLSPEERADISRVIGKFAHAAKRRIQIDEFMNRHLLDLLQSCDELPTSILQAAIDIEGRDKLNPPMEKRARLIQRSKTEKQVRSAALEAEAQGIVTGDTLHVLHELPLEV